MGFLVHELQWKSYTYYESCPTFAQQLSSHWVHCLCIVLLKDLLIMLLL